MSARWYTPAFRLIPTQAMSTPTRLSASAQGTGTFSGTAWDYKWAAYYDGAGLFTTAASSGLVSALTFVNKEYVRLVLPTATATGARWCRFFRSAGGGAYQLVWSGPYQPGLVVDDRVVTPNASFTAPAANTSGTTATINLRGAAGAAWDDHNEARVTALYYRDLSELDERGGENRELIVKEWGVRPVVEMTFSVAAGSDEERDLMRVYSSKLAFPDGYGSNAYGVAVWFTLNYWDWTTGSANPNPIWREVRIVGDMARVPLDGRNMRSEVSWTLLAKQPIQAVPEMIGTEGAGVW